MLPFPFVRTGLVLGLLSLAACGRVVVGASRDGNPNASKDGASQAGSEGGSSPGPDGAKDVAGVEVSPDRASDAPKDGVTLDAGVDGSKDASADAATDALSACKQAPVNLRSAAAFAVLAGATVTSTGLSVVTGDLGVSPAAATFITGFSLTADATNLFSSSPQVTGKVYAADYAPPTPSTLTTAVGDMLLAFADAAGRAPDVTELGAGSIGGMTLSPGVYKWGTGLLIPTDVTLSGSATDVWIFEIAQDLTMASGAKIHLTGGALPRNVFWQVAGLVELGTTAHCEGIVLTQTAVTLRTGATITGRLLAQTAVHLDGSTVVAP
jgi:hypothetical protein